MRASSPKAAATGFTMKRSVNTPWITATTAPIKPAAISAMS
jgi:hypothetical protein